jgi:hypothetical protein
MTNLERAREWLDRRNMAGDRGDYEALAALLDDAEARGESRILDMANGGQSAVVIGGSVSYGYPGKPEEGK